MALTASLHVCQPVLFGWYFGWATCTKITHTFACTWEQKFREGSSCGYMYQCRNESTYNELILWNHATTFIISITRHVIFEAKEAICVLPMRGDVTRPPQSTHSKYFHISFGQCLSYRYSPIGGLSDVHSHHILMLHARSGMWWIYLINKVLNCCRSQTTPTLSRPLWKGPPEYRGGVLACADQQRRGFGIL